MQVTVYAAFVSDIDASL